MDEVFYFGVGRVLPAGAEEVAEGGERDAAVAALVEEGEGFFVVCCCLGGVSCAGGGGGGGGVPFLGVGDGDW